MLHNAVEDEIALFVAQILSALIQPVLSEDDLLTDEEFVVLTP